MVPVQSGRWMSMNQFPVNFCYLAQRQGSFREDDREIIEVCIHFEIKILCNFNTSGNFDLCMCLSLHARVYVTIDKVHLIPKFTTIIVLPSTCVLSKLY